MTTGNTVSRMNSEATPGQTKLPGTVNWISGGAINAIAESRTPHWQNHQPIVEGGM